MGMWSQMSMRSSNYDQLRIDKALGNWKSEKNENNQNKTVDHSHEV